MYRGKPSPFFQEPPYRVLTEISNDDFKEPKTRITASETMIVAQVLAENGRFAGDVKKILDTQGDIVLDTFYYVNYVNKLKNVTIELNRKK